MVYGSLVLRFDITPFTSVPVAIATASRSSRLAFLLFFPGRLCGQPSRLLLREQHPILDLITTMEESYRLPGRWEMRHQRLDGSALGIDQEVTTGMSPVGGRGEVDENENTGFANGNPLPTRGDRRTGGMHSGIQIDGTPSEFLFSQTLQGNLTQALHG
jgi:hypothetical protein